MKMSKPAFDALKILIEKALKDGPFSSFIEAVTTLEEAERSKTSIYTGFLYSIPSKERTAWFDSFKIYKPTEEGGEDLTDSNIQTALKKIIK